MDAATNRGRSKIFRCFKPAVHDDHEPDSDSPSLLSSGDKTAARWKKRPRRSFSAALKAVLFKTSLLKQSRSENSKQDFDGSKTNVLLVKSKKLVKSMNSSCKHFSGPEEVFSTNSDRSPLFSSNSSSRTPSLASSSSASSCSSRSRSESNRIKRSVSLDFRQMSQVISRNP